MASNGGEASRHRAGFVEYLERANPVVGSPDKESAEIRTALEGIANARLAPHGSVPAGQLGATLGEFKSLGSNGGAWQEVTNLPYDEDDPNYRDPRYSNSGGGAGFSAGRITGLAVGNGHVFAGGANGGVFRKSLGADGKPGGAADGPWVPISDTILSLSTGDLLYDEASNVLWYATGEANTSAHSHVGAGVYALANATSGVFTDANRVGGLELESRGINQLKIGKGYIYAATTRGLWRHSATAFAGAWENVFMPNPGDDDDITKPYRNIVNDVAIDPKSGAVLANAAWRTGDAYNGFYLSANGAAPFERIIPGGAINPKDIGNTEFAYSADGSKLYALVQSPKMLTSGQQSGNTSLKGVYASKNGSVAGPWSLIADYRKLGNSGSAQKTNARGKGYGPGIQAWYNNFIDVDPTNPDHVYLGLEEVFETTNGGATWSTPGPYWNFGFKCYDPTEERGGCPETTHSDQHAVAIVNGYVFVGNDGGVKARPMPPGVSKEDALGHAADWVNLSVGLGTLQYYSVGVGADPDRGGYAVSGGLQDNGGSLIRGDRKDNQGNTEMVAPFGGDGGDVVVNPRNGCEVLDEYIYLELWMTTTCGESDSTTSAIWDVSVPDVDPRFTAPFRAVRGSQNTVSGDSERWVAGGNAVWAHDKAFDYTAAAAAADPSRGWVKVGDLGGPGRMTVGLDALASSAAQADRSKDIIYAAWCGDTNCNSHDFTRGVATTFGGGGLKQLDMTGTPNRYPNGVYIDETVAGGGTFYLVFNGFNRRFIEGPGAGDQAQAHVYKGVVQTNPNGTAQLVDGKAVVAWESLDGAASAAGHFPDVPATDVLRIGSKLVVGTDYGVLVEDLAVAGVNWLRVSAVPGGAGALPLTSAFDIHLGPDGFLYAATHGRGIWKTPASSL